jgi:crotonobetainyl-CoA:carnitine CoA-transferase CaiB-like acyl-CoA transferase
MVYIGNPLMMWSGDTGRKPAMLSAGTSPLGAARVIDFGSFVAGPYGGVMLSDLGTDVIKVESLTGDATRLVARCDASTNRGKRNIVLDLKSAAGADIARRLCASANLVMNNFRPGVSARLGLDPAELQRDFPGLATLECPAFGTHGPRAGEPGFDMAFQASCGHEVIAGGEGNPPLWNRSAMVDYCGGMLESIAALTCLYHQARTGGSASANVPLLHGSLYLLSELVQNAGGDFSGADPLNRTCTGRHPAEALYQVCDGWIAIAARDEETAGRLVEALKIGDRMPSNTDKWERPSKP